MIILYNALKTLDQAASNDRVLDDHVSNIIPPNNNYDYRLFPDIDGKLKLQAKQKSSNAWSTMEEWTLP